MDGKTDETGPRKMFLYAMFGYLRNQSLLSVFILRASLKLIQSVCGLTLILFLFVPRFPTPVSQ
jgi:hypothetical protein